MKLARGLVGSRHCFRSAEKRGSPPVLGIAVLQPAPELGVVLVPLIAAVAQRVVAQIQQAAPVRGSVRARAVWSVAAEDRDIAGRQLQHYSPGGINQAVGKLVVHAVPWCETSLGVIPGEHF